MKHYTTTYQINFQKLQQTERVNYSSFIILTFQPFGLRQSIYVLTITYFSLTFGAGCGWMHDMLTEAAGCQKYGNYLPDKHRQSIKPLPVFVRANTLFAFQTLLIFVFDIYIYI
jgi:hypothetical protein